MSKSLFSLWSELQEFTGISSFFIKKKWLNLILFEVLPVWKLLRIPVKYQILPKNVRCVSLWILWLQYISLRKFLRTLIRVFGAGKFALALKLTLHQPNTALVGSYGKTVFRFEKKNVAKTRQKKKIVFDTKSLLLSRRYRRTRRKVGADNATTEKTNRYSFLYNAFANRSGVADACAHAREARV